MNYGNTLLDTLTWTPENTRRAFHNTLGYVEDIQKALVDDFNNTGYPPFNMFIKGHKYTLELAVAGFKKDELTISVENGLLTIEGESNREPEQDVQVIWRGISARKFTKRWRLADYVNVNSAVFDNGILRIELEREVPEELKRKTVKIK